MLKESLLIEQNKSSEVGRIEEQRSMKKDNWFWCERCEVEQKTTHGMDGQCEEVIKCMRYVCGARKNGYV